MMSATPGLYSLFLIALLASFVKFTAANRLLGKVVHPSGHTPEYTIELKNASRYCGNGYYLYLSKQVDIEDPKDEEMYNREYVHRLCTTRVLEDVFHVNHTKYVETEASNVTWGAAFKLNDSYFTLISEFFEVHDKETEKDDKETESTENTSSYPTLDAGSLLDLRHFFIKCKPSDCPLHKEGPLRYNTLMGFANDEMQQQFLLNKNALLDENRHLTSKFHFEYEEDSNVITNLTVKSDANVKLNCSPSCIDSLCKGHKLHKKSVESDTNTPTETTGTTETALGLSFQLTSSKNIVAVSKATFAIAVLELLFFVN